MKIKDLQLLEKVEINAWTYEYRGINKIRIPNIGIVEKVVFSNKEVGDKHFDLKVMNHELKEKDGKLIYKP